MKSQSQQEEWTVEAIVDELFLGLVNTKAPLCLLINTKSPNIHGVPLRIYEEQARFKMYRIPVFRPPPFFVVYIRDLNDRVKKELSELPPDILDYVMRESIGRIISNLDERYYLLSVRHLLRWRLE